MGVNEVLNDLRSVFGDDFDFVWSHFLWIFDEFLAAVDRGVVDWSVSFRVGDFRFLGKFYRVLGVDGLVLKVIIWFGNLEVHVVWPFWVEVI